MQKGKIMGVEAGPSAAVAAIRAGPAISAGPTVGAEMKSIGPIGQIVNEGPVSAKALENTMTIAKFNTTGEIVFKPSGSSIIEEAEAVAAAAWEKSELIPQEVVLPVVLPRVELLVAPQVEPAPKAETRVFYQATPAVSPQPLLQEQEVEEEVLEKVRIEDQRESLEKEDLMEKRLYLEDEQASEQRRYEIGEAVNKAKAEAGRLGLKKIAGALVAKFLPAEHSGNRSKALKEKGPDGSYQEMIEAISSTGEFESEATAQQRFNEIVAEKKPVRNGKQGNPVKNEDVARVFKYRTVKPPAAVVPSGQVGQTQTETKTETSLEDYPELEEVFQKAA